MPEAHVRVLHIPLPKVQKLPQRLLIGHHKEQHPVERSGWFFKVNESVVPFDILLVDLRKIFKALDFRYSIEEAIDATDDLQNQDKLRVGARYFTCQMLSLQLHCALKRLKLRPETATLFGGRRTA